jgi:hypothetical protein
MVDISRGNGANGPNIRFCFFITEKKKQKIEITLNPNFSRICAQND